MWKVSRRRFALMSPDFSKLGARHRTALKFSSCFLHFFALFWISSFGFRALDLVFRFSSLAVAGGRFVWFACFAGSSFLFARFGCGYAAPGAFASFASPGPG
jgi:polyferredoxin